MSLTTVFRRASSRVATLAFRSVRSPLAVRSGSERLILGSQQLSRASAIPFSTESAVTKTTADENLVSVLESEIDCAVKEEAPDQNLVSSLCLILSVISKKKKTFVLNCLLFYSNSRNPFDFSL